MVPPTNTNEMKHKHQKNV